MKIKEISRSYSRKISDGNYGSIDHFCSMTAEVDDTIESAREVSQALYEQCKKEVERSMSPMKTEPPQGEPDEWRYNDLTEPVRKSKPKMSFQDVADKKGWDTPGSVDAVFGNGSEMEKKHTNP